MPSAFMILVQAATAPGVVLPAQFDLRDLAQPDPCRPSSGADIVICGDRRERDRLSPIEGNYPDASLIPRAATRLGGGQLSADAEQVELAPGQISQRAMVRFRLPF